MLEFTKNIGGPTYVRFYVRDLLNYYKELEDLVEFLEFSPDKKHSQMSEFEPFVLNFDANGDWIIVRDLVQSRAIGTGILKTIMMVDKLYSLYVKPQKEGTVSAHLRSIRS